MEISRVASAEDFAGVVVSLDRAIERMLSECMDKASDLPDPRAVEVSMAAVLCAVEENVVKNTVSEFPVREHQIYHEIDGWPEFRKRLLAKTLFFRWSEGTPADRVPPRFRRGGGWGVSTSVSLKCQCVSFAKRRGS